MANADRVVVDGVSYGVGNVTSVNGNTGDVVLTPADIGAKATQTAKSSPSASGTAVEFIDTISQDTQGVITATKKSVPEATVTNAGLMTTQQVGRLIYVDDGLYTASSNFAPEALSNSTYPIKAGTLFIRYNSWSTTTDMAGWHLCRALVDIESYSDTTSDNKGVTYEDIKVSNLVDELQNDILAAYPASAASGSLATFDDGAENVPVKALTVDIASASGVTGATITRCGANLAPWPALDKTSQNGINAQILSNGKLSLTGTATNTVNGLYNGANANNYSTMHLGPFPAGTYTITARGFVGASANDYILVSAKYADNTDVRNSFRISAAGGATPTGEGYPVTFTATAEFKLFVYIRIASGTAMDCNVALQMESGATLGAWEPYTSETYTLDWSGNPGAITAGVLDAVAGKLTTGGQTYDVTPIAVETLLGANTIYADCGDVSVTYRADPTLFANQGQTEDDMTADAPIASGKYFQIGNTLYRATAAIATGETIVPGTNCAVTNIAEALNLLNV